MSVCTSPFLDVSSFTDRKMFFSYLVPLTVVGVEVVMVHWMLGSIEFNIDRKVSAGTSFGRLVIPSSTNRKNKSMILSRSGVWKYRGKSFGNRMVSSRNPTVRHAYGDAISFPMAVPMT